MMSTQGKQKCLVSAFFGIADLTGSDSYAKRIGAKTRKGFEIFLRCSLENFYHDPDNMSFYEFFIPFTNSEEADDFLHSLEESTLSDKDVLFENLGEIACDNSIFEKIRYLSLCRNFFSTPLIFNIFLSELLYLFVSTKFDSEKYPEGRKPIKRYETAGDNFQRFMRDEAWRLLYRRWVDDLYAKETNHEKNLKSFIEFCQRVFTAEWNQYYYLYGNDFFFKALAIARKVDLNSKIATEVLSSYVWHISVLKKSFPNEKKISFKACLQEIIKNYYSKSSLIFNSLQENDFKGVKEKLSRHLVTLYEVKDVLIEKKLEEYSQKDAFRNLLFQIASYRVITDREITNKKMLKRLTFKNFSAIIDAVLKEKSLTIENIDIFEFLDRVDSKIDQLIKGE